MRLIDADELKAVYIPSEIEGFEKMMVPVEVVLQNIDDMSTVTTLYGYNIESLVSIAEIMKREGISPEEALYIFKNNVQKIVEIVRAEIQESIMRHFEEAYFKEEGEG